MHKSNGRLKPAAEKEFAGLKERYLRCEKCKRTTAVINLEFAEQKICNMCGGQLYEFNPYKGPEQY